MKNFNDLSNEEKVNALNQIKIDCECEMNNQPCWEDRSLISIVESHGINYESLWNSYKAEIDKSWDVIFCGVEFNLEEYRESYLDFCKGKITAAQCFLPYEMVSEFDLAEDMEMDILMG